MSTIWELDFYSRPILDKSGKKVWEVVVCESPINVKTEPDTLFRFAEYCASTEVNSERLLEALKTAIAHSPNPPSRIRFFRQAMKNMITKACKDLDIPSVLSHRTYALNQWLQQRLEEEYPKHPGFQPGANPSIQFAATVAQPLPDALIGQKWAFVSLEASVLEDMNEWAIDFSEAFPLSLANLPPDAVVPGIILFSSRAVAMAGWMSGLELGYLTVDAESPPRLLLETGIGDRWILANLGNPQLWAEAQTFETAKQQANGVHFLAIQANPETEAFAGFWLLQETVLA
ncbi:MAG: Tab2/Atab2 family RNA-binding protein [Oscillatoriales cyanobacterium C42_A2020_001]|nr:Tab2/Atab2 family RNA-binding protein [Leptolyngbyaceae cyanobacterium C42_A2020_001]